MTLFRDRVEIKAGAARITPEGYFVADAMVARANNIQDYRARELGLTDRAPDEVVRVFRPESEVFAVDSLRSASRLPITLDHPPAMVDAANWREYAKGETGEEILRDGEFMRVPIRVTDAGAVSSVRTDRREFSLGYSADLHLEAGVFDGQAYDASITNLRYNHLAACRTARGGPELRIVDERPAFARPLEGSEPMPKIILIDGLPVDVSNPDTAEQVVLRAITARDTAVSALEGVQATVAARDGTIAERDASISTLRDQLAAATLTPAALRDAAASYARTVARATALGATVTDEMSEADAKAAAVALKLGDTAKAYTPEQVASAFDVLAAGVKDAPAALVDASDPLRAALQDGRPVSLGDAETKLQDARAKRLARFANAHLGSNQE